MRKEIDLENDIEHALMQELDHNGLKHLLDPLHK
jgi:uncharacterized protein (DUF3820 family)